MLRVAAHGSDCPRVLSGRRPRAENLITAGVPEDMCQGLLELAPAEGLAEQAFEHLLDQEPDLALILDHEDPQAFRQRVGLRRPPKDRWGQSGAQDHHVGLHAHGENRMYLLSGRGLFQSPECGVHE